MGLDRGYRGGNPVGWDAGTDITVNITLERNVQESQPLTDFVGEGEAIVARVWDLGKGEKPFAVAFQAIRKLRKKIEVMREGKNIMRFH
jgi:hypothetical protein